MITCDRCGSPSEAYSGSYFNTETICMECDALERLHPDYNKAVAVENEQVQKGNYNYEGIGLPDGYREWARTKRSELAISADVPKDIEEEGNKKVAAFLTELGIEDEDE